MPVIITPFAADELTASMVKMLDRCPQDAVEWPTGIRDLTIPHEADAAPCTSSPSNL